MTESLVSDMVDIMTIIRSWSQSAPGIPTAEVDTINVILGSGTSVLTPGIGAAIRVDFNATITGVYLQEFDGTTGSVSIGIQRAQGGPSPSFVSLMPVNPAIISGRYFADDVLTDWTVDINRGDYLRYLVTSAASIRRVHVGLRIRRLEP